MKRNFPYEASVGMITNQAHDVISPYTITIGEDIIVTATFSESDDCFAEIDDNYFVMTNVSGSCTGTIPTSIVRSGGPFTITIHAPNAESKDCANPVTITAQEQQTNPFTLIKDMIEDNVVISGWTTQMNDKWWEVGKRKQPQIFFDTTRRHYIEWEEITLPRNSTSGRRIHHIFVGVAGKDSKVANAGRGQRWSLECEMRRVFSDEALTTDPADDVDHVLINDFAYSILGGDKDKKTGCEEYYAIFDIIVIYYK